MSDTPLTDAEIARILAEPMNHASRFAAMVEFAERLERKIGRLEKLVNAIHYVDGMHAEVVDGMPWFDAKDQEMKRSP